MNVQEIMLSIITDEINDVAIDESVKECLDANMLQQLFEISDKHDLAHIIASALSKAGLIGEDKISKKFNYALMLAVCRGVQREYADEQVREVLEQAKIPFIPLKGSVLREYYPKTWMRTSCDVDVLVKEEDADKAVRYLCASGFLRDKDSSPHDYSFYAPNKVHVEVHYNLLQEKLVGADNILSKIWENDVLLDEKYQYKISPEIFILYHIAHMAKHIVRGGCGIRPFIDIWLIENKMLYDSFKLNLLLERAGLKKFYEIAVALSNVWLGNKEHTPKTIRLEKFIISGGTYGSIKNSAKVKAARDESKIKSFFKLMFLSKQDLSVLYPKLKKHSYLFAFYQVKRWFRIFDKNKRERIKMLTDERNGVSKKEMRSMQDLLKCIGLDLK